MSFSQYLHRTLEVYVMYTSSLLLDVLHISVNSNWYRKSVDSSKDILVSCNRSKILFFTKHRTYPQLISNISTHLQCSSLQCQVFKTHRIWKPLVDCVHTVLLFRSALCPLSNNQLLFNRKFLSLMSEICEKDVSQVSGIRHYRVFFSRGLTSCLS